MFSSFYGKTLSKRFSNLICNKFTHKICRVFRTKRLSVPSNVYESNSDTRKMYWKEPRLYYPPKNREWYEKEYSTFKQWMAQRSVKRMKENVILTYFPNRPKGLKSLSLRSKYSMLRSTLAIKGNIDINNNKILTSTSYPKVIAFSEKPNLDMEAPDEVHLQWLKITNYIYQFIQRF